VSLVVAILLVNQSVLRALEDVSEGVAGKAQIEVSSPTPAGMSDEILKSVLGTEGVQSAAPVLKIHTYLHANGQQINALMVGFDDTIKEIAGRSAKNLRLDLVYILDGTYPAALGQRAAAALHLRQGDTFDVIAPNGLARFRLISIMGSESQTINDGLFAVTDLSFLQKVFDRNETINSIYVAVSEGYNTEVLLQRLQEKLAGRATVAPPAFRSKKLQALVATTQNALSLLSLTVLFVSALLLYNIIYVSILERRQEVALLRILGLKKRHILYFFLIESCVLGLVSSALGLVAGYVLAHFLIAQTETISSLTLASYASRLHITLAPFLMGIIAGTLTAIIAALWPACQAASFAPTEAARPRGVLEQASDWQGITSKRWLKLSVVVLSIWFVVLVITIIKGTHLLVLAPLVILIGLTSALLIIPAITPALTAFACKVSAKLMGLAGRIGSDALVRTPRRTAVTITALTFTLMAFIIIGGAVNSLKHSFVNWMDAWLRGELVVAHGTVERNLADTAFDLELADRLERIQGVRLVWPWRAMPIEWQGQNILLEAYHESGSGSVHFDLEQGDEEQAWRGLLEGDSIVISTNLSSRYGVNLGDTITLDTNQGARNFRVGAVVTDYNSEAGSIIVGFRDLKRYWGDARANYFQLFLTSGSSPDQVKADILSSLGSKYPLTVQNAADMKRDSLRLISKLFSLFEALQSVALVIATLTVLNTLSISALQRVREVSLVRMLGLRRRDVRKSMLAEGWGLGLLSWVIALPFGLLLSYFAVRASSLQTGFQPDFRLPWEASLLSLLAAVALASFAALFVDRWLAKMSIVSGIRYE